jgi:uncharacterized protein with PIN domain
MLFHQHAVTIKGFLPYIVVLVAAMSLGPSVHAASDDKATQPDDDQPSLAVLPLEANLETPKNAGEMLAQVLSTRLAAQGQYTVVDRSDLDRVLKEQEVRLSGLVDPKKATEIGKLIGAELLITGRIVKNENQLYAFCKAISVETSELKGFFITLEGDAKLPQIAQKLSSRLTQSLPKWSKSLIPEPRRRPTLVQKLKQQLQGRVNPKVAVVVTEEHRAPQQAIDPAVQTEISRIFEEAGVSVIAVPEKLREAIISGVNDYGTLAHKLNGPDFLIQGEAFSEAAGEVEGLTVAVARAELKIVDLTKEQVIATDSATARVPDLAEHLAAKSALQQASNQLARKILPDWIDQLPKATD